MNRNISHTKAWGAVIVVILIAVVAVITQFGDLVGARLDAPDVGQEFRPLVRHQISQKHCYDDGSDFCESKGGDFAKEYTLGYLLKKDKTSQGTKGKPLYSCAGTKNANYTATLNQKENCKGSQGYNKRYTLGYLLETPDVEASTAIYQCFGQGGGDTLLTDDPNECALVGYGEASLLGYAASAGNLPTRRLTELCALSQTACAAYSGGGNTSLCGARAGLCKLQSE